ncbi:hypothetical protein Hanom_Chr04g00348801 [Helianthus anomalus]
MLPVDLIQFIHTKENNNHNKIKLINIRNEMRVEIGVRPNVTRQNLPCRCNLSFCWARFRFCFHFFNSRLRFCFHFFNSRLHSSKNYPLCMSLCRSNRALI